MLIKGVERMTDPKTTDELCDTLEHHLNESEWRKRALRVEALLKTYLSPCDHARALAEVSDPALREEVQQLRQLLADITPSARLLNSTPRHAYVRVANDVPNGWGFTPRAGAFHDARAALEEEPKP
jgi:chemotaxis protein histidine kinase CheA